MSVNDQPGRSAQFCAELVRTHDFARYAAALVVPAPLRRGLLALYAFNVEVSRIRDQVSQPMPGEIRLRWWSDMLAGAGHGGVEGSPVAAELLLAIRNWDLPVDRLSRLVEEHQFDLYNDPMPTLSALEGYLNETSAALFALAAQMAAGRSAENDHLARHAGLAQGMAQVVAALPFDAAQRRLFVPMQLLERHGSAIEELFARRKTPQLRAALDELIGAAAAHQRTARTLVLAAPVEVRKVFLPLALVGPELRRMSRADHDPFQPAPMSRLATLWTLWRASWSRPFRG